MFLKHQKRCYTLVTREIQISTTRRFHFKAIRMAGIKKITSLGKDMAKLDPSYIAGGNVRWYNYFGKQVAPQKVKHTVTLSLRQFHS
jgi:hypothetical protein